MQQNMSVIYRDTRDDGRGRASGRSRYPRGLSIVDGKVLGNGRDKKEPAETWRSANGIYWYVRARVRRRGRPDPIVIFIFAKSAYREKSGRASGRAGVW